MATPSDETGLLREYVEGRSQEAFRRLVDRYVNVVYAAARRQVGDADLARDVTQAVFLVLAEKAGELDAARPISGWLLQVTRYAAANAVRARARRARHEQRAAEMATTATTNTTNQSNSEWEQLAPLLDEGMGRLRGKDRDVLLLRFFEQKTAREIGLSLGISEDAAEKRVARAVGKLRDFFQRRGVAVSLAALTTTLAANCAEAAPLGLTSSIAAGAAAASAATTSATAASSVSAASIAKGTVIAMASAKTKAIVAAGLGLLLLGGGTVAVTSMLSSSRSPASRHVEVAAPVGAANATASPSLSSSSSSAAPAVQFSQGTAVEIVGISDVIDEGDASRWWAADGTPLAAPPPLPRAQFQAAAGQQSYQIVLRQTGPQDRPNHGVMVALPGAPVAGVAAADQVIGGVRHLRYLFSLNGAPPIVDVRVSFGSGIWETAHRFPLAAVGSPASPAPAQEPTTAPAVPQLIVNGVSESTDGFTEVNVRFTPEAVRNRRSREEKLALVTADGREIYPQRTTGSAGGNMKLGFRVKRSEVVALTYQYRPYEVREIRNVSLQPGQKTVIAAGEVRRGRR